MHVRARRLIGREPVGDVRRPVGEGGAPVLRVGHTSPCDPVGGRRSGEVVGVGAGGDPIRADTLHDEGPGPAGLCDGVVEHARRGNVAVDQKVEQVAHGLRQLDTEGQVVDRREARTPEILRIDAGRAEGHAHVGPRHPSQRGDDGLRIEGRPVMEPHALAQCEGPEAPVVGDIPPCREGWHENLPVAPHQRVVDRLQHGQGVGHVGAIVRVLHDEAGLGDRDFSGTHSFPSSTRWQATV